MKTIPLMIALAFAAVPLAGCVNEEESAEGKTRGVVVSIPEDVHTLQIEVNATASGTARIQIEVEEENGTDIQEENFEVSGGSATRVIEVDVGDRRTVAILVTVAEGDATIDLVVRGVRDAGDTVIVRQEHFVIVVTAPAPSPSPAADTTTTPSPTPAATPSPTPSPTPPPTNETNETNETNTTNETNSTP